MELQEDSYEYVKEMGCTMQKCVLVYMWTPKTQIRLPIRAVWSEPSLFCPPIESMSSSQKRTYIILSPLNPTFI